jgi:hypothetical protein
MIISTPQELIDFLKKNYLSLSDDQYFRLVNTTLKVYPLNKPKKLEDAINMIQEISEIPLHSRPIFPELQTNDFDL